MEHHHEEPKTQPGKKAGSNAHHASANPPMDHAGHDHHAMMIDDFKKRFYVVLFLTIPIMLLSEMIQHWLNIHISFPGSEYVLLALSSIVFFYGGWPFLKGLVGEMEGKESRNDDIDRFCHFSRLYLQCRNRLWIRRHGFLLGTGNANSDYAIGSLD